MFKNYKKQIMVSSTTIAAGLLLGVFCLFTAYTNTAYAAASNDRVGVVNYRVLVEKHPEMAKYQETIQQAVKKAQSEYTNSSKGMTDAQKQGYSKQLQQNIEAQKRSFLEGVYVKIDAAVKAVAEGKGIKIVVDKSITLYDSVDITEDVLKRISTK